MVINAAYGRVGCTEEDLELFNEMGLIGIKLDRFVLFLIAFVLAREGFWRKKIVSLKCEKRQG